MAKINICGQKFSMFINGREKAQEVGRDAEKGNLDPFLKLSESTLEVPAWGQ